MDWDLLLSQDRRRASAPGGGDPRHEFERDYDRILFSAPLRRLADKTEVFPLEKNDTIHRHVIVRTEA